MKECKEATIPVACIPRDAIVTGTALLEDFDGYYSGKQVRETHKFKHQLFFDLLKELDLIEYYRKEQHVRVIKIIIEKISFSTTENAL